MAVLIIADVIGARLLWQYIAVIVVKYIQLLLVCVGRVAQLVQRLVTGWMVRGSNPGGGEVFCICPDWPWGPPSLQYNGYRVFPGSKEWPGRDADPSPPSSAEVKKGQSYTSTPLMGRTACTEPQCLYRTSVPVQSLSACTEPQCLYRASVPVQSLSACTEPQCLYRTSVPVQRCTLLFYLLISVFVFVCCDIHLAKLHFMLLFLSLCDCNSTFQVIFAAWSKVSYIRKLHYWCYMLCDFIIAL